MPLSYKLHEKDSNSIEKLSSIKFELVGSFLRKSSYDSHTKVFSVS